MERIHGRERIIRVAQILLPYRYRINHTTFQILAASAGRIEHCNHCN